MTRAPREARHGRARHRQRQRGLPQLTPIWVGHDGQHILINTKKGLLKERNPLSRLLLRFWGNHSPLASLNSHLALDHKRVSVLRVKLDCLSRRVGQFSEFRY